MSNVLKVIRMFDDKGEEWTVPLDVLQEKVRQAISEVAGSREQVEIESLQVVAKDRDFVTIDVRLKTTLLCLGTEFAPVQRG